MWVKNVTVFLRFCYLNIPCLRINTTLIFMSSSKRWIHAYVRKLKNGCFCWFPGPYFVPLKGTPSWCLHTKPYKFGWNIFPNILHISYRTDLILGEAFYIFAFFHFPDLDFLYWLVCILIFDGMTVKTQNSATLRKSFICIDICHSVS